MKKIIISGIFLVFFIAGPTLKATAQEREERQSRGAFNEISVSSGIDLFLKQGEEYEIIVEADKGDIAEVITEFKGNRLDVYMDGGVFNWFRNTQAKVYVTVPEVSRLSSSGGSDLKSMGEINGKHIEINCSGGADVEISVSSNTVLLHCSGGADIKIDGKTDVLKAESSGGADIFAKGLHANRVVASSSGGADIEVYAIEEIEASASGGADVAHYGPAKATKISESGGGDVRRY
ncbi:MAG: head GIN domain-containing protein [Bacteroidota bacterium]